MTPITVACVFVRGPYPYTLPYVTNLRDQVRRYLGRPHRFVCLTDRTEQVARAGIEAIPITVGKHPADGYWGKVQLFNPALELAGRVLYLDLDSFVVAPLDPVLDFPAPLALTEDALVPERSHIVVDRYGRGLVRRFNSSVMVWDAGAYAEFFTSWTPAVADRLSTDQDWFGEQAPDAAGMPLAWFPRISQCRPPWQWPDAATVILVKKGKPHEMVRKHPELRAWWEGTAA